MEEKQSFAISFMKTQNSSASSPKSDKIVTLHIEVCQTSVSSLTDTEIKDALEVHFANESEFVLNTPHFETVLPFHIKYVRISSTDGRHKINFSRENIIKRYHIYQTWKNAPEINTINVGKESYSASLNWTLPNTAFEGLWESLVVENGLKEELISYVETALLYSKKKVNAQFVLWNGIILLHGPPGTGKTSLCKALAQKLSIRLNSDYLTCQLIEVNSHNLFSHWYSESAKIVHQFFENVKSLLQTENNFVCILIDEVESLTQVRNSSQSDPSDSVKVVNTVLTQIDQLQHYPNFLILATSNVTEIIDLAFADRADLKLHIKCPTKQGIYEIYRSCLEELIFRGLIKGNKNDFFEEIIFEFMESGMNDEGDGTVSEMIENSKALLTVSEISENLSGRTLRKIPFLTSAKFINEDIPTIKEFIQVMSEVVYAHKYNNKKLFKF